MKRQRSFELADIQEQKEMFEPGTVEKAEEYYNRMRIVGPDGKPFSMFCSLDSLRTYGQGPYFYFLFLKYTIVVLIFCVVVNLGTMWLYYHGGGLGAKVKADPVLFLSLGNLKSPKVAFSKAILMRQESQWQMNLDDEYSQYLNVVVWTDFAYSLILLVYFYWWTYYQDKLSHLVNSDIRSAAEFTLEVKNIPEDTTREEVAQFFQSRYPQHRLNQINFAYKFNDTLGIFVKMANLEKIRRKFEAKLPDGNPKKALKLKGIEVEIAQMEATLKKEMPVSKTNAKPSPPGAKSGIDLSNLSKLIAYVIFEESASARAVKIDYDQKVHNFGFCGRPDTNLYFNEKRLVMNFPDHPDNIKWENMEVAKRSRIVRGLIVTLMSLVVIAISFIIIFILNLYSASDSSANLKCGSTKVTYETMLMYPKNAANYMAVKYCFCKDQPILDLLSTPKINTLCESFLKTIMLDFALAIIGGATIAITNMIIEKTLTWMVGFEKYKDLTREASSTLIKIFLAAYTNTVLVTLFVTAEFPGDVIPARGLASIAGIPSSDIKRFTDFYRDWYQITGVKIAAAMVFSCFMPHVAELLLSPLMALIKRKRLSNKSKLQYELNEIIKPDKFDIASNYGNVLNMIFVCLTFSGGMPTLLVINIFGLFCIYWCHKINFVRHTLKPPQYNNSLTETVSKFLPFALLIHLGVSIWTYGVTEIFPVNSLGGGYKYARFAESFSNTGPIQSGIVSRAQKCLPLTFLFVVVLYALVFEHVILRLMRLVCCYNAEAARDRMKIEEEETVHLKTYTDSGEEIRKISTVNYDLRNNESYKPILLLFEKYYK